MTAPEDRLAEVIRAQFGESLMVTYTDGQRSGTRSLACAEVAQAVTRAGYLPPEDVARVRGEALREARDDIRSRIRVFRKLDAHPEYMNALNDAWGLVANRERVQRIEGEGTP